MRTIFIPLSKAYGLYIAYTGLTYALMMMPVLSDLLSSTDDEYITQTITSIYGTNIALTVISFISVILITVIAAWILIMKADWLSDKLGLSQSEVAPPTMGKPILYAGIKLVGLYVIVQGIPAFVQGLFYMRHSPPFGIYVWSMLAPPLLRIGIGVLLITKTSFIFKRLDKNTKIAEQ